MKKTSLLLIIVVMAFSGCRKQIQTLTVDEVLVRIQKAGYKMKVIPLQALTEEEEINLKIIPQRKFSLQLYEEVLEYKHDVRFFMFKSEDQAESMEGSFDGFVFRNWFFAGEFDTDFQKSIEKALSK